MIAGEPALGAAPGAADAFLDAVLGLDRLCERIAWLVDDALAKDAIADDALADDAFAPEGLAAEPAARDDLLDALLGLVSLRTTAGLVLAALRAEADETPAGAPAGAPPARPAWSGEHLR